MYVLGIIGFGENPAACLVQDGQLISFAEEERFTRFKSSHGMFPSGAVGWCLTSNKLTLGDIDRIAFGWDAKLYPWRVAGAYARSLILNWRPSRGGADRSNGAPPFLAAGELLLNWHPGRIRRLIRDGLRSVGFAGEIPTIEFVPHHLAHAYSAYAVSGFDRAGILTMDGSGETTSTQLAVGDGENIKIVDSFTIPHSLGWFYAAITQYLGFIPNRDEGKLMGLAALGEERRAHNRWIEPLSRILKIGVRGYEVDPVYTQIGSHNYGDRFTDALVDLVMAVDSQATPIAYGEKAEKEGVIVSRYLLDRYVDIAWAAQDLLERAAVMLAKRLVREQATENICVAGGVALNCKMNGEILRQSGAKKIYVQPASNDSGVALGAALLVSQQMGANIRHALSHAYYGPRFSNDEIKIALDGCQLNYTTVDDPSAIAANFLAEGDIIGWFQGPMEFGSRALGNRSILANPAISKMRDRVNTDVKYREPWRPFCPSMTEEVQKEYLRDPGETSFMTVAYEAQRTCSRELPAVVHVDGTIRPQAVKIKDNPAFHALIKELGRRSGHEVVLNTSFNVRGEPIICRPLEAVRCFFSGGLDSLVIGNFVLRK